MKRRALTVAFFSCSFAFGGNSSFLHAVGASGLSTQFAGVKALGRLDVFALGITYRFSEGK